MLRSLLFITAIGLWAAPALAQDAPAQNTPTQNAPAKKPVEYVRLTFRSSPAAQVWYGKKLLGTSPVTIRRKRDSGPVDVVFKAGGYLKMNSRAYSWSDDVVSVRLIPVDQAHTVFGYQKPVEEDEGEEEP